MIVADANLLAYLLIDSPHTRAAERARAIDDDWIAPTLIQSELLNLLASHVRIHRLDRDIAIHTFKRALSAVRHPDPELDPIRILVLCAERNCTAYDAQYVVLAERHRVPLVTDDREILKSFPDVAVSIEAFGRSR